MSDKIPTYKAVITKGEHGLQLTSLVDDPAMESNWITLSKESVKLAKDGKKQILTGALLIPDKKIPRLDPETEEPYYLTFTAEDIELTRDKFFKDGVINLTNQEHSEELEGNYVIESWIVENSKTDKSVALGLDEMPVGTWMISYKVEDSKYWENEVITGNVKGFSIEGLFGFVKMSINKNKMEKKKITFADAVRMSSEAFASIGKEVGEVSADLAVLKLEDGTPIEVDEESREVFSIDEEGNRGEVIADGEYVLEDGTAFKVLEGKWEAVEMAADETEEEKKKREEEEREVQASKQKVISLSAELEVNKTEKESIEAKLSTLETEKEATTKKLEAAEAKIMELSRAPAALPVEKAAKTNDKPMTLVERAIAGAIAG